MSPRAGLSSLLGLALLSGAACRESVGAQEDESESSSESSSESGGSEGFPAPDECASSEDCEAGYCVSSWDGEPPRGPAQCVDSCVEQLDLSLFCIDDASCCEGLSCSLDGLCEPPWTGGDGDGDTGDGDGDSSGDGDGDSGDGDSSGDGDGDSGDGDGDSP